MTHPAKRSGGCLVYNYMDMDILIKSIGGNIISIDMSIDMDISGSGACRVFFFDFEDLGDLLDPDFDPFDPLALPDLDPK